MELARVAVLVVNRYRNAMKRATRLAVVTFLLSHGCNGTLRDGIHFGPNREIREKEATIERPPETDVDPIELQWQRDPRLAFDAALRSIATQGFDVTTSNTIGGVLKAERTDVDRVSTAIVEAERQRIWNGLTYTQQQVLYRDHATLTEPATISRRLMLSVITTQGSIVVTPTVEVCAQHGSTRRECAKRSKLQDHEVQIVARVIAEIEKAKSNRNSRTHPDVKKV